MCYKQSYIGLKRIGFHQIVKEFIRGSKKKIISILNKSYFAMSSALKQMHCFVLQMF